MIPLATLLYAAVIGVTPITLSPADVKLSAEINHSPPSSEAAVLEGVNRCFSAIQFPAEMRQSLERNGWRDVARIMSTDPALVGPEAGMYFKNGLILMFASKAALKRPTGSAPVDNTCFFGARTKDDFKRNLISISKALKIRLVSRPDQKSKFVGWTDEMSIIVEKMPNEDRMIRVTITPSQMKAKI